ncbi:DUF1648 domain-containing protein [Bacillus pumilus]|uniref:DUF1648 domain-containing protein n=2 Tax=Bacillaceae TaxID=186817 RepID=UPI003A8C9A85
MIFWWVRRDMYWLFNNKVLLAVIVLTFLISILAYPFSYNEIPIHFNGWNESDLIVKKYNGLFISPVCMIIAYYMNKISIQAFYAIYLFAILQMVIIYMAIY